MRRFESGRRLQHKRTHCASLLLAQGVHPSVVIEALGHSNVSLTMNVIPYLQCEAAATMDAILAGHFPVVTQTEGWAD